MGENPYANGTIGGSQIVSSRPGQSTGDRIYETADGRQWHELRGGGVPNTLPTGASIETIRYQR